MMKIHPMCKIDKKIHLSAYNYQIDSEIIRFSFSLAFQCV